MQVRRARTTSGCRPRAALIWNQPAPLRHGVARVERRRSAGRPARPPRGRPTPHGSSGGTVRMLTGPVRPWWSPGASLVSRRLMSGQHSSALQPVQPIAAHSSRSSRGVQKAMHELCDEHPPSTLARAWRRNELPLLLGLDQVVPVVARVQQVHPVLEAQDRVVVDVRRAGLEQADLTSGSSDSRAATRSRRSRRRR